MLFSRWSVKTNLAAGSEHSAESSSHTISSIEFCNNRRQGLGTIMFEKLSQDDIPASSIPPTISPGMISRVLLTMMSSAEFMLSCLRQGKKRVNKATQRRSRTRSETHSTHVAKLLNLTSGDETLDRESSERSAVRTREQSQSISEKTVWV